MVLYEFLGRLHADGFAEATAAKIQYARHLGKLGEVPRDAMGNCNFGALHLRRMKQYLQSPRKRGRTPRRDKDAA